MESEGFEVGRGGAESDEPRDQVVETDPPPATSVPEGSTVTVFYSDGPEQVPGVVGPSRRRPSRR